MTFRSIAFLLSLIIAFSLQSQGFKLIDVSYALYPDAKISEAPNDVEAGISEFNIELNIPKVFNEGNSVLVNGVRYSLVTPSFKNATSEVEEDLHIIGYALSYIKKLSDRIRFIGAFRPSISSQLSGSLSGDDFLFLGSAALRKSISENKSWTAGLVYTSRFGEPIVLPLLGYSSKSEKFLFEIVLPGKIEGLRYNESTRLEYGLKLSIDGSQFNLNTTDMLPYENVRFSRINLGPTVNYGLTEHIFISVFSGLSTNRVYDFTSDTQDDLDFDLDNGFFGSFSLYIK